MKRIFKFLVILLLAFPAVTQGECIEGDCANGFGIYIFPEGGEYSGEFAGGEFAAGKQLFADGNRFEGTFVKSTPHGEGVLTYADGSIYSGQFDMGVISGRGTIVFANKSKYEGEFAAGVFHGKGVYTYSDGSRYDGEFKEGKMDGKGTLYSDGRVYTGEFKNGEQHGKGTITYYDKSQETGEWKNGKFVVLKRTKASALTKSEKAEDKPFFEQEDFVVKDVWTPETDTGQNRQDDFFGGRLAEENNRVPQ